MKNKNMKWLITAGLGLICIVLAVTIASQFKTEKPKDSAVPSIAPESSPVAVKPSEETDRKGKLVIEDRTLAITSAETSSTADSSGTKQTIQPDPVKPKPAVKPKPPDKPAESSNTSTVKKDTTKDSTPSKPTEPSAGEKKDGKIYVPGFGWIKDNGGGVQQNQVGSDGDIDKQVGEID